MVADHVERKEEMTNLPTLSFVESPNFSDRATTSPPDLIVVHDTEGGYQGAVSWFQNPKSQVSAHVVLREDGMEATQMVPYAKKAWHCAGFNSRAIGLEMAGLASKGYAPSELRHAARIVAFFLHKYGLPPKLRFPNGVNKPGYTLHQYLGVLGGGHHDPGFSRVKALWFAGLVKFEYRRGGFRAVWGRDR